jgi:hypothetical protein
MVFRDFQTDDISTRTPTRVVTREQTVEVPEQQAGVLGSEVCYPDRRQFSTTLLLF